MRPEFGLRQYKSSFDRDRIVGMPPPMTNEELDNLFQYHHPHGTQTARYEMIRAGARSFARALNQYCPDSREKSLAITNLQNCVMWANASIAVNEPMPPDKV